MMIIFAMYNTMYNTLYYTMYNNDVQNMVCMKLSNLI